MTWITGEYPVSDDAWPERMASMAPASICAMARRSELVAAVSVVGARTTRAMAKQTESARSNCGEVSGWKVLDEGKLHSVKH